MTPKSSRFSARVQIALVALGLLVLALGGYMLLVKPKQEEAERIEGRIAAVESQIADRRSLSEARQVRAAVKAADLFRLAKAIPSDTSMASIILELNRIASDAGIVFDAITPQAAVADNGFHAQPISLSFSGNFFSLTDFLFRLRQLVQVHEGRLGVTGRLFSVRSVTFSEDGERNFPFLTADLEVDAFVFGPAPGAPTAPAAGTSTTSTDAPASTTQTTPTEQAPASASAAPTSPSN